MNDKIKAALEEYRKSKLRVITARQAILDELPESVASSVHYNGYRAIDSHPEYSPVINALFDAEKK